MARAKERVDAATEGAPQLDATFSNARVIFTLVAAGALVITLSWVSFWLVVFSWALRS
jgi:hypothetical protein